MVVRKVFFVMSLASIFFISGCATVMTKEAARIKIATPEEVKGFEYLGMVEGSSSLSGIYRESGFRNSVNEALNKAAAIGATHLVLDKSCSATYWASGQYVRAEAYKEKRN